MRRTFEELAAEAEAADVTGWDFSWLEGRATEQRPSWRYQHTLSRRLPQVSVALDLQTGGGEVLAAIPRLPTLMVATEGWPPNVAAASHLLHPRGVAVLAHEIDTPLPFAEAVFDLVVSRHPVGVRWPDLARVLRPGGSYLAQHVGPASVFELVEYLLGPQLEHVRNSRHPDHDRAAAKQAGLEITDLRAEQLRVEFFDIAAVIYFLRKVVWMVPGFTVAQYRDRLRELHERIEADGVFVAHSSRFLIEARRPTE